MDNWMFKDYLIIGLLIVNFYYIYTTLKMSKNNIKMSQIIFDPIMLHVKKIDLKMDKLESKMNILNNYCMKKNSSETINPLYIGVNW